MKLTNEQKENHRRGCRLLAALAVEHGLRLLSADDPARKLIEEDIRIVREGSKSDISRRYTLAKKRRTDGVTVGVAAGRLLCSSRRMLHLAKQQSLLEGFWLASVFFWAAEAAGGDWIKNSDIYGDKEERAEQEWQEKNLWPLESRLFQCCGELQVVEDVVNFKEAAQ
jgi:hypothetical protein